MRKFVYMFIVIAAMFAVSVGCGGGKEKPALKKGGKTTKTENQNSKKPKPEQTMAAKYGIDPTSLGYKRIIYINPGISMIEPGDTVWIFYADNRTTVDQRYPQRVGETTGDGWHKNVVRDTIGCSVDQFDQKSCSIEFTPSTANPDELRTLLLEYLPEKNMRFRYFTTASPDGKGSKEHSMGKLEFQLWKGDWKNPELNNETTAYTFEIWFKKAS